MDEAESPTSPTSDGTGMMNCHFSVNQVVLRSMVEPMLSEMLRDRQHDDRLAKVEAALDRAQCSLEQKADAKVLRDVVTSAQEQRQALMHKADQRVVAELKAGFARLEDTVSCKAPQTSIDEVAGTLQRLTEITAQKADLSYVNRTNERVNKLSQTSSQQEKQLAELIAAKETTDAWRLPQTLQRTREMLLKTNTSLKTLQDVVSGKADQRLVDQLILEYKDIECNVNWKASQQSIVDVNMSVQELQRQLDTKVEHLTIEAGPMQELEKIKELLPLKAGQQEFQELVTSFKTIERSLSQKADFSSVNDNKARFTSIEVSVHQKADRQEFKEVTEAMTNMREWMAQKVDQLVLDFSKRPEAEALVNAESAIERLLTVCEQKVDTQAVHEVEQKLADTHADILRQLEQKVEQASFEETLESFAKRLEAASPGSARSGYPPSSTSLSTTDSYPNARGSGKGASVRSSSSRGVSPAMRSGRPPRRESKS